MGRPSAVVCDRWRAAELTEHLERLLPTRSDCRDECVWSLLQTHTSESCPTIRPIPDGLAALGKRRSVHPLGVMVRARPRWGTASEGVIFTPSDLGEREMGYRRPFGWGIAVEGLAIPL